VDIINISYTSAIYSRKYAFCEKYQFRCNTWKTCAILKIDTGYQCRSKIQS